MSRRLYTTIFVLVDVISVNVAIVLAFLIRFGGDIPWQNFKSYLLLSPFITFISLISFYIFELYDRKICRSRPRIVFNAFRSSLAIFISCIVIAYIFQTKIGKIPSSVLGLSWILTIIFIAGWRLVIWYFKVKRKGHEIIKQLVILGTNQSRIRSFGGLINPSNQGKQVIRFAERLGTNGTANEVAISISNSEIDDELEMIRDIPSLISFIEKENIQEVFIESEAMSRDLLIPFAQDLADREVELIIIPDQYEVLIGAKISTQGVSFPAIRLARRNETGCYMNFRRLVDIAISIVGLTFLFLLYPIIAALIKLTAPGPVFYKQERIGWHGQIFKLIKFRSMIHNAEKGSGPVLTKANDSRITPIGKFMRKTRLDEVPQFINVLKGEMSFIGPRPERPHFINNLKEQFPFYIGRLQVKPGITGWAQVNVGYDKDLNSVRLKLHHDLYYIENISILLDFIIILKSIRTVLTGKGAQ